jgi:hypothetical protein
MVMLQIGLKIGMWQMAHRPSKKQIGYNSWLYLPVGIFQAVAPCLFRRKGRWRLMLDLTVTV